MEAPTPHIQYAELLDYEKSKLTESSLKLHLGQNFETYQQDLLNAINSQGKEPVFGEDVRILDPDDESMGESTDEEWSGGDRPAPNQD